MKTIAFVPIKLNNERTPGKNLKKFYDGKALLTVFLESLVNVKGIDKIYVFCSDDKVKEYLVGNVEFLQRPSFLDSKEAKAQDLIREFVKIIDADIYAMCHCTSPFITKEHFEECIKYAKTEEFDSSFTAERMQRLIWKSNNEPLNFDAKAVPRTQDLPIYYSEVPAMYAFKKEVFTKYERRVGLKPHITEVSGVECVDIDYPEDFEIADAIYRSIIKK